MLTRLLAPSTSTVPAAVPGSQVEEISRLQESVDELRRRLNGALRGKPEVVELVLAALLAQGHVLIEDLPGLGKTTLAKALAGAIDGQFARIQCTPDLLPGDITGFNLFNQQTREFEFQPGPVFADVLLVDEVNRATPRTQSALLEAMAEHQVTVDNVRRRLSASFFVLATQNPVDHHGTYPLPEAQMDRFAMRLRIGYPDTHAELAMLEAAVTGADATTAPAGPALSLDRLRQLQQHVQRIIVVPPVQQYLVALAQATRAHPRVRLGLSPRGLLVWQRTAQAWAFLNHRPFVTPDDIQDVALPVLDVRIAGDFPSAASFVQELLAQVPVPAERR